MAGNFNQSGCSPCCGGGDGGGGVGDPCASIVSPSTWTLVWSGTYQWEGWGCPPVPACSGSRSGNYYTVTDYGGQITLYQCPTNPCVWDSYQGGCADGTEPEYHTVGNILHQECLFGVLDSGTNYPMRAMLTIDYGQLYRIATLYIAAQYISVGGGQYSQFVWQGNSGIAEGISQFDFPIALTSVNCFTGYPFHVGGSATVTPNL